MAPTEAVPAARTEAGRLLIVGGSARAAAWSARRGGYDVWALDQYADADLQEVAFVQRVERGYRDATRQASRLPPCPWIYTGGLENHPGVIEEIQQQRPLLGIAPAVLRRVRDPFLLSSALRQAGFDFPEISATPPRDASRWLRKPFRSCGGLRIRFGHKDERHRAAYYWQQYLPGRPLSGVYLADDLHCELLGVVESLMPSAWAGSCRFHYTGSLGPLSPEAAPRDAMQRLGEFLATHFQLRGLFGVDTIVNDDQLWVLEVNPRFTASVELVERGLGGSLVARHCQACRGDGLQGTRAPRDAGLHGKAIVYATCPSWASPEFTAALQPWRHRAFPLVADVPPTGTLMRRGSPLVTIFARASSRDELMACLAATAGRVRAVLSPATERIRWQP